MTVRESKRRLTLQTYAFVPNLKYLFAKLLRGLSVREAAEWLRLDGQRVMQRLFREMAHYTDPAHLVRACLVFKLRRRLPALSNAFIGRDRVRVQ